MSNRLIKIFICLVFLSGKLFCQNDSLSLKKTKNRKIVLVSTSAALTAGSLVYLNQAWYQQYNTGKFHLFNDNAEWLQMDKVGHIATTYQTSRLMMRAFDWAGFNKNQKLFIAPAIGFGYMAAIELMDGFSKGWGFSWGDMGSNVIGTAIAITQEEKWGEQRIQIKYSFSQSGLAQYNPDLLGENFSNQILKDYNGQTYWASINPSSFLKKPNKFPKWLSVAFGYNAYGMLGARYNAITVQDEVGNVLFFERERRFYLSVDVDLTRIKTKSKFLKSVFSVFNMLKFPAPALQLSKKGARGYWVYM